jgi:choline dehydrogenase
MRTAPLADIIDHTTTDKRLGTWLPTASPAELREYVRKYLETLYHPTSTARMAPLSDGGVVDARLKVHGVQGLRIVDASIFPMITSGHTVREFTMSLVMRWRLVTASPPMSCLSWNDHG